MPAIPRAPSSPLYLCYFHESQGLVVATNCTVADISNSDDSQVSTATTIWIIILSSISYLVFFYFFYLLLTAYLPTIDRYFDKLWSLVFFWRAPPRRAPSPRPPPEILPSAVPAPEPEPEPEPETPQPGTQVYYDEIKKSCTPDELLLWDHVTFPDTMTSGFEKLHLPADTIETVKSFATPLLQRRNEFAYGVLSNNIIPGLVLHGPPGTGKTQLVKVLAKHYQTRVLSISAGRIHQRWFGESEKAVVAAFSLAKKLSPCILFVDEADSMLRKRRGDDLESEGHRSTLAQFLSEWDGFDSDGDKAIFVVLATNRPTDLDDAVLRRAPKRIVVGIPSYEGRVAILKIHLQGEQLDTDVSIEGIARKTDKFTGSDLKNLCIAAAYACIFEDSTKEREIEVPVKAEGGESREGEIDVELINLEGDHSEINRAGRDAEHVRETEDHTDVDDDEHGEDIPLLPLPTTTTAQAVPQPPPPPPAATTTPPAGTATASVPGPPRRLLKARHFAKAIKDITPTSSSSTLGVGIGHFFESGIMDDKSSQASKSNTTRRTIVIPRSRVPL